MENDIKAAVRQKYGTVAASVATSGCCEPGCCSVVATAPSYADVNGEVVAGSELGLGCGTPTRFAALRAGEAVLDLGSGAGVDVFLAAQQVGPSGKAFGLDLTEEMLMRARRGARDNGYDNVEFVLGDIENLPFEDDSFDCLLSNCVVNLAPDKPRVFAEVARVLRPAGRLAISDIVTVGAVPAEVREDIEQWTGCIAGAMDRDELLRVIEDAGLERVRAVEESDYEVVGGAGGAGYGARSVTIQAWMPAAS